MSSTTTNKRRTAVVVVGSFGASVLPDEVTTDVLLRLPVKSILRFRAVCRSWAAALSSEEFCSLHTAKAEAEAKAAPQPKLIFISPSAAYDSTGVYLGSSSDSSNGPLFTLDDVRGNFAALSPSPCRGLTLLHDAVAPAYYVFNAATRAVTRLPPCQHAIFSTVGLGFDASTKEYKVVRLRRLAGGELDEKQRIGCEVYVLGGEHGDRWRPPVDGVPFRFCHFIQTAIITATWTQGKLPPIFADGFLPPVFADGFLHWLMMPRAAVLSFSLKDETFVSVRSPPFEEPRPEVHLVDLAGRLCMVRDLRAQNSGMMEIWNYSSGDWSLLHTIDLSRHLEGDSLQGPAIIRAIGYVGDCGPAEKVILATSKAKVITYDLLSGTLDTILAMPETSFYKTDEQYAPRFSLFKESLAPVHKTDVEMALSSPLTKVIKEILLRLPGDFAARFKLVSKQWLSLIESGSFIRSYHAHNNMDREPKVMLVGKGPGGLGFSFAPSKKLLRDGPSQGAWLDTKVVCSKPCHGMNLISTETEDYLYNPSTGYHHNYHAVVWPHQVRRRVLALKRGNVCTLEDHAFAVGNKNAGLGFNMLKQEHVVVQIFYHVKDFESRKYFLTCSVIGLTSIQHNLQPHLPINSMPPAYVAGVLYWMSEPRLMQIHKRVIVSFDVTKMMFDLVPCPSPIAMWSDTSPCQAFVVELEGMLCAVLADPVAEELDIWKLEHGRWDRAYKVYLEGWSGYSLGANVVVPLLVDPRDGRILLNTGRKLGLYDPARRTIENLYDLDGVLQVASPGQSSRLGVNQDGHVTKGEQSFRKCGVPLHGENPLDSKVLPLVPLLYEESLASYPPAQSSWGLHQLDHR
ncbi:hypothetical protein ACQJBY_004042 [Aegilops geniculata]